MAVKVTPAPVVPTRARIATELAIITGLSLVGAGLMVWLGL